VDIRAPIQRAILEQIYADAIKADPSATLIDALTAFRSAKWQDGAGGGTGILIGTTDKHASVTFSNPTLRSMHPDEVLALAQLFIERYRIQKAAYPSYTDAQLLTEMLTEIRSVRSYRADFSRLDL
jgi:hypothetical protein